jgi:uncharacterized damage-inducible protein DinB
MMRSIPLLFLTALLGAAPSHSVTPVAPPSVLAGDREVWRMVMGYVTAAAEQVPDSSYSYRPTPTVRTFGQLVAHIAGSQDMFCALALGDEASASDHIEKTTTGKAALVAALKASIEHCQRAYAMTDADAMKRTVKVFAGERSALWALLYNTVHDDEHYGNIVTYMRMLGMVPPSSQPSR